MSGVTVPANIIVEPFGIDSIGLAPTDPGAVTLPIPVADQTGITVGAASFATGFPAATMVDPDSMGGVPPFGQDFNGILFMLSAYCAMLQAGQRCIYEADASAAFVGYVVGATLDSATTPGLVWVNVVDGNTNDPDVNSTGWVSAGLLNTASGLQTRVLAAGITSDLVLNAGTGFLDLNPSTGPATLSGIVPQFDGQFLTITNVNASNAVTLPAFSGSSAAGHQFRFPDSIILLQYLSVTLRASFAVGKWVLVS
jgi:hypothetical protein